jgi:hypothetical protein
LQIKRSAGINRDKNDKADSYQIALYAYRFKDKAKYRGNAVGVAIAVACAAIVCNQKKLHYLMRNSKII